MAFEIDFASKMNADAYIYGSKNEKTVQNEDVNRGIVGLIFTLTIITVITIASVVFLMLHLRANRLLLLKKIHSDRYP